jgi:hypothetical protein
MGATYRFRIKVINVETTAIEAQFSFNLKNDAQTAFLLTGKAEIAAAPAAQPAPAPAPAPAAQPAPAPAPAPAARPAPAPATGDQSRPGLYVNGAFQGAMGLYDAVDWLALNVKPNGNYVIVLGSDEKVSNINFSYQNQNVTITLKAAGGQKELTFDTKQPAYPMITVGTGVTFIMEDGVALTGLSSDSQSLISLAGGTFTMNGGFIRNNKCYNSSGGVYVSSGTFTMNNGTISGNTASSRGAGGGGVHVSGGGVFTMQGGTISGNTAGTGGGVYVTGGTFTKSGTGGVIYGSNAPEGQANKASDSAAAVYTSNGRRVNTARLSTALDSRKSGPLGGWE